MEDVCIFRLTLRSPNQVSLMKVNILRGQNGIWIQCTSRCHDQYVILQDASLRTIECFVESLPRVKKLWQLYFN